MSTIQLSVLMQLRRLGFGRNPLRRRVDRLESALLLGVLVAALLVVPAAAVLGTTIHDRADHTALSVAAGLGVPMVVWPLLWGLVRWVRLRLDRRCAEEWAREWEQVAPRWTRRPKY